MTSSANQPRELHFLVMSAVACTVSASERPGERICDVPTELLHLEELIDCVEACTCLFCHGAVSHMSG